MMRQPGGQLWLVISRYQDIQSSVISDTKKYHHINFDCFLRRQFSLSHLGIQKKMATITTSTVIPIAGSNSFLQKRSVGVSASTVLGLPAIAMKGRVKCAAEEKSPVQEKTAKSASHLAAVCAAAAATAVSSPAMALVDERLSTEGTGLPFGLSNNLLVWIILGVFGLIWAFYVIYTSTLEEDEESGLSL